MSARVVSEVGPGGRLVARKRSQDDDDAARLRHEAEVLEAARHPGVVELVSCELDENGVVLTTEFVGTHSLETLGLVEVERAAGIVAALADTIADLHDVGVVHGRIEPSHVLVGSDGRPILCGFAGGGRVGTTPPPGPLTTPGFCDPVASSDATLSPHGDVYSLGCLLRWMVQHENSDIEPIPEKRFALTRMRASWSGFHHRALLNLADRATDEVASRRPPARRLAQDLIDTIPTAALSATPDPVMSRTVPRHRRRRLMMIGLLSTVALIALFAPRGSHPVAALDTPEPSTTHTSVSAPTSQTLRAQPPQAVTSGSARCGETTDLLTDDLDGDGCGDPVHVEDGRVVVVGTQRFIAGDAGDRVVVGDWSCDGVARLAVLRPSSGAIFVFDGWATSGADVSVAPTATIAHAVDLETRTRGDGCDSLVAIRPDGSEQEVM